ncbi:DUF420 domain-containing protein [Alteribacter natronophilus]|uniref:DUF420 domain-containing protein n=1 Tax=Alteribacter natronophilus TaxID=2583810 RepID=UPI00110EC6C3|nr:DUF420 domain-containing protein [Alteribacter natronophilus]TMW73522.1 DUF420 domain-containing protein [Alteribacter natronophilus]
MKAWKWINRNYVKTVIVVTLIVNALVIALSYLPGYQGELPYAVRQLPLLNATLNSFTFIFLVCALVAILWKRNIKVHQRFIYAAFTTTFFFLISYVTYHFLAPSTSYGGEGWLAGLYYFILITHIVLAAVIVPLALMSFFSGYNDHRERHRKWVRFSMPMWLYVSLTGVLVYILISPYY